MLKALFAHDHHFYEGEGVVYSESQFPASLWQRYLAHFDQLTVFAREERSALDKNKAEISSTESVSFVLSPSISSLSGQLLRRREVKHRLRQSLQDMDAVIARLPSEFGLMAVAEAKKSGIPYTVELVGCPWDGLWNYGSIKGKLYAPVMALRVRTAVAGAQRVIYVTQQFLQSRYPNTSPFSVGCSDVEIGEPDNTVLAARLKRIESRPEPLVLGLIGTLKTRYKGIQTVLEALSKVQGQLPNVEFRVIGSGDTGPWEQEANRFGVGDIVSFQGTLPGGDPVVQWLDGVDLYLQPSFKEGLPRALIEAMSRGCPVVASKCAGIPELIEDKCLMLPGDASHLGELIVKAVTDVDWQVAQAQRNWQVAGEYSSGRLEQRRRDFWAGVAEEARSERRIS